MWLKTKFTSSLCIVTVFLGILHAPHASSLVLCIGADGHSEVEAASDGDCSSVIASEAKHRAGEFRYESARFNNAGGDHCGDCSDIPLAEHEEFSAVSTRHAVHDDLLLPSIGSLLTELNVSFRLHRLPNSDSRKSLSYSLVSLRSVLLQR
ncbi:MAG: hypothetical protein VCD00_16525 [Candidatus Hydrogenedentota bacterium]